MDEAQIVKHIRDNLIFEVITGSRSYGLETEHSDTDTRGAFVQHPRYILGTTEHFNEFRDEPAYYAGISKWAYMLGEGKPNFVELLFGEPQFIKTRSEFFEDFIKYRNMFLTKELVQTCLDMADGFLGRSPKAKSKAVRKEVKPEQAAHALRILKMARELLQTGVLRVYRPDERNEILPIKFGQVEIPTVESQTLDIDLEIKELLIKSPLLEKTDKKNLDDMLISSMVGYWNYQKWI